MTCQRCGETFDRPCTRGPAPKWCSNSCRQRTYEERHAHEHAIVLLEANGYTVTKDQP